MIIETNQYREILTAQLQLMEAADHLAAQNKRYNTKSGVLVVQNLQSKMQVICGNFASFRNSSYHKEWQFHSEFTVQDLYSSELDNITYYISKLNLANEALPSRPCRECMIAIRRCDEITSIVYRDDKLTVVEEVIR